MNTTRERPFPIAIIVTLILFCPSLVIAQDGGASSCSIYDAVYKPHSSLYPDVPALKNPKSLRFTLTTQEPLDSEKGSSHRTIFFTIDAFDKTTNAKVSSLRMADFCNSDGSDCGISTMEGQFHSNKEMKDMKYGLSFPLIALHKDFSRAQYYGAEAPYAFVFPGTLKDIYVLLNKTPLYPPTEDNKVYEETLSQFVRFYTADKVFPNFSGYDIWVLDSCAKITKD